MFENNNNKCIKNDMKKKKEIVKEIQLCKIPRKQRKIILSYHTNMEDGGVNEKYEYLKH